jgi:hypothetical protein
MKEENYQWIEIRRSEWVIYTMNKEQNRCLKKW